MKKVKLLFIFVACFALIPQVGLAQLSGANEAKFSEISNTVAAGAAGSYAATNQAKCSSKNPSPCIKAIMGILQMVQSLMGAMNSGETGAALLNGDYSDFAFEPSENGFCFDTSTGCSPDGIDQQLAGLDTAFKTGEGYGDALSKLKDDANKRLKDIEAKGFKVDSAKGTITGPNGKVTSFAAAAAKIPKNFGKEGSEKLANVLGKLKANSKFRGVASTGGAGGTIFKDEYYGGSGSRYGKKGQKDKAGKNSKKAFLASLTDKGARKDALGVAGDNIFGMVNRRYIKKTKSAEFLKK